MRHAPIKDRVPNRHQNEQLCVSQGKNVGIRLVKHTVCPQASRNPGIMMQTKIAITGGIVLSDAKARLNQIVVPSRPGLMTWS
jgi:hypothetical protein